MGTDRLIVNELIYQTQYEINSNSKFKLMKKSYRNFNIFQIYWSV